MAAELTIQNLNFKNIWMDPKCVWISSIQVLSLHFMLTLYLSMKRKVILKPAFTSIHPPKRIQYLGGQFSDNYSVVIAKELRYFNI